MRLVVENTKALDCPSSEVIRSSLVGATFAVLTDDRSQTYIQFMKSRKRGIELEHRDGSMEHHFRATDPSLTMDRIVQAFQKYASGEQSWKTDFHGSGWK